VLAAGTWLFWRSHADLGVNWSARLALRDRHDLVTAGVYARVRHPMYAALIISGAGQALVLANLIAGFSLLAAALVFYSIRIPREERMMIDAFGDRYRTYMARTGRVFPRFGRRVEPDQESSPRM
jgi:protein-S-isoprenylcysteine O-methyltransferase Ste14